MPSQPMIDRDVPWFMQALALITFVVCLGVAAYALIFDVATIPGLRGRSITLHGPEAQWTAPFFVGLGTLISSFVLSSHWQRKSIVIAILLITLSIFGGLFAKLQFTQMTIFLTNNAVNRDAQTAGFAACLAARYL